MLTSSRREEVVFPNRPSQDKSGDDGRLSETYESRALSTIRTITDDVDCAWSIRFSNLQDQFLNQQHGR